jgi:hypothetical protein
MQSYILNMGQKVKQRSQGVISRFLTHFLVLSVSAMLLVCPAATGQVIVFPYHENFDSATPPVLPAGWGSTGNRGTETLDMTVSQSASRSSPNCVSAANATVAQALTSPEFDFGEVVPEKLSWFMRRSSTFSASVIVECSTDGGGGWTMTLGDTLRPDGSATYVESMMGLPRSLAGMRHVKMRWRVIPSSTGSAGTLRFDDISVTAHSASDLALVRLSVAPPFPRSTDLIMVTGIVKNVGLTPMSGFSLGLYRNCGDTLHPVPCNPVVFSPPLPLLCPGDSVGITLPGVSLMGGVNTLLGVVRDTSDRDQSDNWLDMEIDVAQIPGGVVINEIMFAPFTGEGEYVEFLNNSDQPVNLTGWQLIAGKVTSANPKTLVLPTVRSPLLPGKCAAIAEDPGIFRFFPALLGADTERVVIPRVWETRLNNAGEDLVLKDARGTVVDSVFYSPSWHNPAVIDRAGRSLERILASGSSNDSGNWSTCALPEGGTPARGNSVALARASPGGVVSSFPNPFSPDGDGVEDATVIRYQMPPGVWSVSVRIFDARGRAIRTLATCTPSTGCGEFVWDGRDQERATSRMGIYIVYVEATDAGRLASFTAKGVVVLARRPF